MTKVIKLKKGLDINLAGRAEKLIEPMQKSGNYALIPSDFQGITPKMLVKPGDRVKAGSPVFFDKYRPNLIFTSPVSGVVNAVNRGDKRKILNITIDADSTIEYQEFDVKNVTTPEQIKELMLTAGLWAAMIQRPYGVIADETKTPKSIFISLFDSAPLAPDMSYILEHFGDDFKKGIEVLKKLTTGKIYFGANESTDSTLKTMCASVGEVNTFIGKHPAGCVGIQINHISPIAKGDTIWTVDAQMVAIIGRFFETGKVDMKKIIAVTGSEIKKPSYQRIISGASISSILGDNIEFKDEDSSVRIISGNVLTGIKSSIDEYISFYSNQLTVIPEGDKYEFLGWIAPRFNKFSTSNTYFSWLCPKKEYKLDTNTNGDERAFVVTGEYEKVLPMDIYPVYLIKAIMANDIDKMENLGIYEVIEEDMALCEFVCTSKIPVQQILRNGINTMIKELS